MLIIWFGEYTLTPMNTPDTPKTWNHKQMILAIVIGLICSKIVSHMILHIEQWWLDWIVGGATTGVVALLVLWITGRFRRG